MPAMASSTVSRGLETFEGYLLGSKKKISTHKSPYPRKIKIELFLHTPFFGTMDFSPAIEKTDTAIGLPDRRSSGWTSVSPERSPESPTQYTPERSQMHHQQGNQNEQPIGLASDPSQLWDNNLDLNYQPPLINEGPAAESEETLKYQTILRVPRDLPPDFYSMGIIDLNLRHISKDQVTRMLVCMVVIV